MLPIVLFGAVATSSAQCTRGCVSNAVLAAKDRELMASTLKVGQLERQLQMEVAQQLAQRHFCIVDDFLSASACTSLLAEVQRAHRSGRLQETHATIGAGRMYGQAHERHQQAQRGDRIGGAVRRHTMRMPKKRDGLQA